MVVGEYCIIVCLKLFLKFLTILDLCGTPGYLAPETLKCNMMEDAPGYSFEIDM